jgi:S1-C subfamily serine protease
VASGSGADDAGIRSGDLITRVGRTTVSSASELSDALASSSPKDKVDLTWVDGSTGSTHHATITLQAGPPA